MKTESLSQIIKLFFPEANIVATFNNESHIEFIFFKTDKLQFYLLWLPTTLLSGVQFHIKLNPDQFLKEFQETKLPNRLTYLLKNCINSDFFDIDLRTTTTLQNQINNGLHN